MTTTTSRNQRSTGPLKEYYATYTRSKRFTKKETFSVFNFFVYSGSAPILDSQYYSLWMEHTHQSETPGSNRQYLPPDFNVRVSGMAGRKWKWNAVPWMSQQLAGWLCSLASPTTLKLYMGQSEVRRAKALSAGWSGRPQVHWISEFSAEQYANKINLRSK